MNEDSDAESDFETELQSGKAAIAVVNTSSSGSDSEENLNTDIKSNQSKANIERMRGKLDSVDKSLCLSESADDEGTEQRLTSRREGVTVDEDTKLAFFGGVEEGEQEASLKLLELAGNLEKMKDVWKEKQNTNNSEIVPDMKKNIMTDAIKTKKVKSSRKSTRDNSTPVKTQKTTSTNLDSISKLLAVGEGVTEDLDVTSDDDTKPAAPLLPKEGVEVTISLPQHLRKKKKKGFDVAAFLKRELSRARRELAVLVHKNHLTCLLAHLMHLHTSLSTSMLQGLALSIVPESHCHKPDQLTLARLGSLLAWVREA